VHEFPEGAGLYYASPYHWGGGGYSSDNSKIYSKCFFYVINLTEWPARLDLLMKRTQVIHKYPDATLQGNGRKIIFYVDVYKFLFLPSP
jgi:hypothetical protein